MARYRNDLDDDRDYTAREDRMRRESAGSDYYHGEARGFENERRGFVNDRRSDYSRGQYGERAEYRHDEPRYSERRERFRDDTGQRSSLFDVRGDLSPRTSRGYAAQRSRLRCRDIMTRDLVVATRDTPLTEVARMMKQEDTGVIPVVEYDTTVGNGKEKTEDRNYEARTFSRGRLVGLITDRDVVVRAVADGKDCSGTRAEEVMSTSIHTAPPNDRVVDVIRKMGSKQVRRIPVVNENGYLMGMISMADIANETQDDAELGEALEEISKGSSFWNKIFG